jgi:glycosyltransferase involved in cell wall biosynthesis
MKLSLVIVTYNWPQALELVLLSIARQKRLPDEVVIADDGSGPETVALIGRMAEGFPAPLLHARQDHRGARAARARNMGIARTSGDYVVLLDGDLVAHPSFLADHARQARPGVYTQGSRANIGPEQTRQMLHDKVVTVRPFSSGLRRRRNAFHAPLLGYFSGLPRRTAHLAKCGNMGAWRSDIVRVNGFNEDMQGWGREDNELVNRMINAGIRRRFMRFSALTYHLHHAEQSRDNLARNDEILTRTVELGLIRCDNGLDKHPPSAAADPRRRGR